MPNPATITPLPGIAECASKLDLVLGFDTHWDSIRARWRIPTPKSCVIRNVRLWVRGEEQSIDSFKLDGSHLQWAGKDLTLRKRDLVQAEVEVVEPAKLTSFAQKVVLAVITIVPALLTFVATTLFKSESEPDMSTDSVKRAIERALTDHDSFKVYLEVERDPERVFIRVGEDIMNAESKIDIISWKDLEKRAALPKTSKFFQSVRERLQEEDNSTVLRRLLWKPEHLQVAREWAEEYGDMANVEFRYYNGDINLEVPFMPCVIIDSNRVHFGLGYLGMPGSANLDIMISHPEVVQAFGEYFNYLWSQSTPIKERGCRVDLGIVEKLESEAHSVGM